MQGREREKKETKQNTLGDCHEYPKGNVQDLKTFTPPPPAKYKCKSFRTEKCRRESHLSPENLKAMPKLLVAVAGLKVWPLAV